MTSHIPSPHRLLLLLPLAMLAAILMPLHAQESAPRDGAFIHLSAGPDNPHRVLMALKMAVVMAEGKKDALVYCDIDAVKLVVNGAPDVKHNAFDSSVALLAKLAEMKIPVRACPSCLKAAGKTPEDLLPGIKTADRDEFFSFTKGRILTIDY
ncbi:MAG: peroxiredoxin [Terrimicrobiaceae bacterium]